MSELVRVNDPDDLELVNPLPVAGHTNFYYFPDDHRLGVNRKYQVMNTKTGKVLKGQPHKGSGSIQYIVTSPGKKATAYKAHRIIARTFIGRPSRHLNKPFKKLQVNHIDGNRANNSIGNLEWVTGNENVQHGHLAGLYRLDSPVLAKNIETEAVKYFVSIRACAEHFGIHPVTLHKHLRVGKSGSRSKNGCVFKRDDGSDWVDYPPEAIVELGTATRYKNVLVKDIRRNIIYLAKDMRQVSKLFGIKYGRLWRTLVQKKSVLIEDDLEIRFH